MADTAPWGVDTLFSWMRNIADAAERERAQISMNNARLMEMNAGSARIADPAARATFRAWIAKSVTRQAKIVATWRATQGKIAAAVARARAFLVAHGIKPSGPGLSGLGAVPLVVPIVIVGFVLAAWAAVVLVRSMNGPQTKAIDFHRSALDALVSRGASAEQLAAFIAQAEGSIAHPPPGGNPFGALGDWIMPAALVLAAVLILPRVMPHVTRAIRRNPARKARRAVAA